MFWNLNYERGNCASHDKSESVEKNLKKFMCSKCPKRCAKFTDAQEHELKYHFEHYNCPNCYKVYALDDIENFRLHLFKHSISNKPSNKCKQCGKLFRANWALQKHMKRNLPFYQ